METRATLRPGQKRTHKLVARFGDRLVRVRYLYDADAGRRYKTVETSQAIAAGLPVALRVYCYYNLSMTSWDEPKRRRNIKAHGLYFEGSEAIWDNFTVSREDLREDYGEKRMVTFGLLNGEVVVLVHIERQEDMHVISLRKAEKYEARYYFETAEEYFRKGR